MSTYQEAKLNEVNISNEYASPNATSQLGTLSTLKLLSQAKLLAQGNDNIAMIAAEEIKYLEAAMKAISTNQGMKNRYGGGFSGVQELAEIIKSRQSERVYNEVMDSIIKSANTEAGNNATFDKFGIDKALGNQGYTYIK